MGFLLSDGAWGSWFTVGPATLKCETLNVTEKKGKESGVEKKSTGT